MAETRYDLTTNVEPFLDAELQRKIDEFNGIQKPKQPVPALGSTSEPNLEAAQSLYAHGKYVEASDMLSILKGRADPTSDEFEAIVWGKLAADLLAHPEPPKSATTTVKGEEEEPEETTTESTSEITNEYTTELVTETATETASTNDIVLQTLAGVHEMLDLRRGSDSTTQLNRYAWLIHWALFAYFNGRLPKLVDTYFASQYMSVIHAVCPWILRYVVIAVVVSHPRTARFNRCLKDMIRVVQQEIYEYSDPVLLFVQALYIDYDFSSVALHLDAAANTLKNDFFAQNLVEQFVENGQVLIADTFLRVHEQVPVSSLATTLGLKTDVDQWIQRYIQSKQEAKLDAQFNEESGTVRVTYSKPTAVSQVVDRMKGIDQRAHQIQQQQKAK